MNLMLQRLSKSGKCEQDCAEAAVWAVAYPGRSQPLCRLHTLECMSDQVFWRTKMRNGLSREMA
jgi:hypothetical protein